DLSLAPRGFAEKLHQVLEIEGEVDTGGMEVSRAWYLDRYHSKQSHPVDTEDTIGAGGALGDGLLHGRVRRKEGGGARGDGNRLRGEEVEEALQDGNRLGGYVAARSGAIPEYDGEIRSYFADQV